MGDASGAKTQEPLGFPEGSLLTKDRRQVCALGRDRTDGPG